MASCDQLEYLLITSPTHQSFQDSPKHSLEGTPNSYRLLVQRYEALLEEKKRRNQALGIQDEFPLSSDFSSINTKDTDDEKAKQSAKESSNTQNAGKANRAKTMTTRTPTDFSEVSSGFSDETSNKATQTEGRAAAGSFLCTITDGEDCKFSIYDEDSTSIDSRFRNRPEYRELFKEIFQILKKAAENREEGDKLPLLDDEEKASQLAQAQLQQQPLGVPPVTPATEELPYMMDNSDAQSIASSMMSETSVAMSECITKTERKKKKKKMVEKQIQQQQEQQVAAAMPEDSRILANKRDQLEYLSVAVKVKKRDRKNRYRTPFPDYPQAGLPTPPRFFYGSGRKRREFNPFEASPFGPGPQQSTVAAPKPAGGSPVDGEWTGDSMTIYNRNMQAQNAGLDATTPTNPPAGGGFEDAAMTFRPSTASQEIQRLKKLELTYAEVLRRADEQSKQQSWNKQQQQQQQTNVPMQQHQSHGQSQAQYHGHNTSFNNSYGGQSRQQRQGAGMGGGPGGAKDNGRRFNNQRK